jgi:hypothetical protein
MSALRALSTAARAAPLAARTLGRRGYAEAASDKLKLSFVLPHQVHRKHHAYAEPRLTLSLSRTSFDVATPCFVTMCFSSPSSAPPT